jgi:heme exporter protein A
MAMFEGRALACHRGGRMVFAGLDFALEPGEALVLRGPNGSGKSTLLRLLALLTPPRGGELFWRDQKLDRDAHRQRLRFIGHIDALKPALSVLENLVFAAHLTDPACGEAQCLAGLERLELRHLAEQPTRFLSAGQKRRLALARLAATNGELWLLDEPGTGLDARALQNLHGLIAEFRTSGGIVVLSTHGDLNPENARLLDLSGFTSMVAA